MEGVRGSGMGGAKWWGGCSGRVGVDVGARADRPRLAAMQVVYFLWQEPDTSFDIDNYRSLVLDLGSIDRPPAG